MGRLWCSTRRRQLLRSRLLMPAQAAGGVEWNDDPTAAAVEYAHAHRDHSHERGDDGIAGPSLDPRVAALAMLSLHAARGNNSQVQADSSTQAGDAGRGEAVGSEDAEVRLPGVRKVPTGEGYCKHCHFIVGTYRRRLIRHAGYWALWTGGAVHKSPEYRDLCQDLVVWCEGSGKLPSPEPENMIDPWEYHVNLEKS